MRIRTSRPFLVAAIAGLSVMAASPAPATPSVVVERMAALEASEFGDSPWLRVREDEGRVLKLEIAVREFAPIEGDGPRLTVAGAVHVADSSFYRELQETLDATDLVLFEGVSPAGADRFAPRTAEQRVKATNDRIRLLATLITQVSRSTGTMPGDLDGLQAMVGNNPRTNGWVMMARNDGWGNPIVFEEGGPRGFTLTSLGADGEPGGKGIDRDLTFDMQPALGPAELGEAEGIQAKLARALGLKFQLLEMDEAKPNWRNSDMSIGDIQLRLGETGADDGGLFDSISGAGTGLSDTVVNMLLGMLRVIPGIQPRVKMMLMEILTMADTDMMSAGMPGGDGLVKIIIDERNQVVMDDLNAILGPNGEAEAEGYDHISIIYGAGHMEDLVPRIAAQAGYVPVGERWVTAISLDMRATGISPSERRMVRQTIMRQLAMAQKQAERAAKRRER